MEEAIENFPDLTVLPPEMIPPGPPVPPRPRTTMSPFGAMPPPGRSVVPPQPEKVSVLSVLQYSTFVHVRSARI